MKLTGARQVTSLAGASERRDCEKSASEAGKLVGCPINGPRALARLFVLLLLCLLSLAAALPAASQNFPFTLDFETGDLRGWTKTGNAFDYQPTLGDNPTARHRGQLSNHQGSYWIGTYERYQGKPRQKPGNIQGDEPTGTLTSTPFMIPKGTLSFLIGGGSNFETRVELLMMDPIEGSVRVLYASGRNSESMSRVTWKLDRFAGRRGAIRIVDASSGGWGHINVDDFRFSSSPGGVVERRPAPPQARIAPPIVRVTRGERAVFESRSTHDPAVVLIRQEWSGPGGRRGEGRKFTVATDDLAPGIYRIVLDVLDNREQSDRASATLEVLPRAVKYRLDLRAFPAEVEEGRPVRFRALLSPPRERAEYRFSFGDGSFSGWSRNGGAAHSYFRYGIYHATVAVREGEKVIATSERVRIEVTRAAVERRVLLTADRQRVKTGEPVRFRALLKPPMVNVEYVFSFGEGKVKSQTVNSEVEHRYESAGTFRAIVRVKVGGKTVAESPAVTIAVERPMEGALEKTVAKISPSKLTVRQGEDAVFESFTTHDPKIKLIREEWTGPGGQQGEGLLFRVSTENLTPGTYKIGLTVLDQRERKDKASAVLEVRSQPTGPVEPVLPRSLSLSANPQTPKEGETVVFEINAEPYDMRTEYRLLFGDGEARDWSNERRVEHVYGKAGSYNAVVFARIGDRMAPESEFVLVTVERQPSAGNLPWVEVVTVLFAAGGYYVLSRMRKDRRTKRSISNALSIRSVSDPGIQDAIGGAISPSVPTVTLKGQADMGEQVMETGSASVEIERRDDE